MVRYLLLIYWGLVFAVFSAQATGITGIQGRVVDQSTGEPLAGATVIIDAYELELSTDENGYFRYLGLPPGSYQIVVRLLGYNSLVLSEVWVSPGEVTQLNLALTSGSIDSLQRQLAPTTTISSLEGTQFTAEQLNHSPRRGVEAHLALGNGVIAQDDQFHLLGSRQEEIGQYVNGQWATDVFDGQLKFPVIQEAIQTIQLQPFANSIVFEPATAGIVQTVLKTGGERFQATVDFHSDKFAEQGNQFLGTYSYRWQNMTLTLGGPLFKKNFRYFLAYENTDNGDRLVRFTQGLTLSGLVDQNMANPVVFQSGHGDTVTLALPEGFTPHNELKRQRLNGTLVYLGNKMSFQSHILYQYEKQGIDRQPWFNVFNDRYPLQKSTTLLWSGSFTHQLTHRLGYRLQLNYLNDFRETEDSYLGNNWQSWYDSLAVAQATNGEVRYRNRALPQYDYLLGGFYFSQRGDISWDYRKQKQQYVGGNFQVFWAPNAHHQITMGVDYRRYTLRYFQINPRVMLYALPYDDAYSIRHGLPRSYGSIDSVPVSVWMLNGAVMNYGYDIYGNPLDEDKQYGEGVYALGAPHPEFTGVYVQDHWRLESNVELTLGLRYDYFNPDQYQLKNPTSLELNDLRIVDYGALEKSKGFREWSPRLSIVFHRDNGSQLLLGYGRFVQLPRLSEGQFIPFKTFAALGLPNQYIWNLSLEPIRTHKLVLGYYHPFQSLGQMKFNIFYRSTTGLPHVGVVSNNNGDRLYFRYQNTAESVSKGLELEWVSPNFRGFNARLLYTYSINTGNASFADSYWNLLYLNRSVPQEMYPLDYHQAHQGAVWLNYSTGNRARWSWLNGIHVSAIFRWNSGHPFTQMSYPEGLDPHVAGVTFALPNYPVTLIEQVNASRTPWNSQLDLRVDKTVTVAQKLALTFYVRILNVFNTRNVLNVYPATGNADYDGVVNGPTYQNWVNAYGNAFDTIYRTIKLANGGSYYSLVGKELWGHPRQLFIGMSISY